MDKIIKKHPGTSIFAFRELSRLEVSEASSLLQRVIDEGLSIAKMKKILKDCPSPPPETTLFALQRIRGKANKERKRKGRPRRFETACTMNQSYQVYISLINFYIDSYYYT
uniref:Uncharacterized protein n=1 Tax=Magallana gigas TaxID=29159 RepID=A0A8W8MM14_MAGGI